MCKSSFQESIPVPDFDFDDFDIIPLNEPFPDYPQPKLTSNIEELVQQFGFILRSQEPIKATKYSSVYQSYCQFLSEDGSTTIVQEFALKISKKKFLIQREFDNFQSITNCEYLVQSYDLYESPDLIILQMELCQGDILGLTFNEADIWKLIHDVASALNVIHSAGFIHLDISPSNILMKGNQFKLGDFGTVIENGAFERGNEGAGPYVSPEVIAYPGNATTGYVSVGPSADIFSFGVVLLEIASGYYAPRGGHPKYAALRNGEIQLNDENYPTQCSMQLVTLVNKMLATEPLLRPTANQILMHPMVKCFDMNES